VSAVYDTTVHHARQSPLRHSFRYRSRSWLVDLDALPRKGFEARDHVGDPDRTLRQNVDALLATHGLRCSRVLMLASPRRLGHVFNPLSVLWCLDDRGGVVATVAEVHNTYGGRHAYVLPDGTGVVDKAFYVSPFHEVDGRYELDLPVPDAFVRLTVTYHRAGAEPFVASVRGVRLDRYRVGPRDLLATRLVAWRIRVQGVRLWARRLPVVPRPPQPQEIS
jgi:DUF1365 family protein